MIRLRDRSTAEQRGWYLYDFAQSAFSTTVATLFLGPYLTVLAQAAADAHGMVHPLGVPVDARSYWSYMISLSVILQVVLLPIVGAVADYGRRKKETLGVMAYLGAAATMAMFFLEGEHYLFGGVLFLIADVSFGAGLVIYDSFLPEIAPPEDRDALCARCAVTRRQ
jgi:UMF1 family MFS transporter